MTDKRQYRAEVLDEGGAGTGWHVYPRDTLEAAILALADALSHSSAGAWRLTGPDVDLSGNARASRP